MTLVQAGLSACHNLLLMLRHEYLRGYSHSGAVEKTELNFQPGERGHVDR